jgi:hypothetical protein
VKHRSLHVPTPFQILNERHLCIENIINHKLDSERFTFRFDISVTLCVVISVGVVLHDIAAKLCTGLFGALLYFCSFQLEFSKYSRQPEIICLFAAKFFALILGTHNKSNTKKSDERGIPTRTTGNLHVSFHGVP